MREKMIYDALRSGGLSPSGACAMMGNMWAESGLKSNNVQDNCTMSDHDYTYAVDKGMMTRWQFMADDYGYGLCQWTLSSRKDHLYEYARSLGVSIADEKMQCDFCLYELQSDYGKLYQYLCETDNLYEATERICKEFERPAVNNIKPRFEAAQKYFAEFASDENDGCSDDACQITPAPAGEACQVVVRILRKGDLGRDVFLLQNGLTDIGIDCGIPDGDFGPNTERAVLELQRNCDLNQTGVVDQATWQIIFQ